MRAMNSDLIVIPTYNERDNVRPLVESILAAAPGADIMLVDDGSPDGTAEYAERLFGRLPNFHLLRRSGPRGLGCSYIDAYRTALAGRWTRIVQMDADLSHDPCGIPVLLESLAVADVVVGSRYCLGGVVSNWSMRRRIASRISNAYMRTLLHLPVRDATSGYRSYTRSALERIDVGRIRSRGFAFQVEAIYFAHRSGLRIVEVPIVFTDRRRGRSKVTLPVIVEMVLLPWRLGWQAAR